MWTMGALPDVLKCGIQDSSAWRVRGFDAEHGFILPNASFGFYCKSGTTVTVQSSRDISKSHKQYLPDRGVTKQLSAPSRQRQSQPTQTQSDNQIQSGCLTTDLFQLSVPEVLQKLFCSSLYAHPPQAPRQTYLSFVRRIGSTGTCLRHMSWFRPTSFGGATKERLLLFSYSFLQSDFPSILSYPPRSSSVKLDTNGGPPENASEKRSSLARLKASCT